MVVDARGLRCPLPVIRLAAAARELPAGTLVTVLSTDPAARHDVPAWARMRGHAMVGDMLGETDAAGTDAPVWSLTVRLGSGA
ncbi:sulfurtransferase TusA family protein [Krasilnikoviella flava]|nr:sulfurtransferase TusA family protein [Krasilnikoviella flava]